MMNNYKVSYSGEALSDLRAIYSYIAYYLVDDKTKMVIITRIFYGGRDIKGIINSNI